MVHGVVGEWEILLRFASYAGEAELWEGKKSWAAKDDVKDKINCG
jgi:hypothetical protein